MHFTYAERLPSETLTPWIAAYWEFTVHDGAPPIHHVPPDGCTSLLIPFGGPHEGMLLYSGPWLAPLLVPVEPGNRFVGIRLRPGATAAVLNISPQTLFNTTVPAVATGTATAIHLQQVLRQCLADSTSLMDATHKLDALWSDELREEKLPNRLVSAVVDVLVSSQGESRIASVAAAHGCSDRTLRRRFNEATGLSPKQFARVRRLLAAAWHAVDGVPQWGRIAAEAGFADHAHLHHEVKDLMGLRPEELSTHLRGTRRDKVSRHLPDAS